MKLRHLVPAAIAGMCLRLFFIARFPYVAGDSELYQDLARNIVESGVYGIYADGALVPASMRMPGYPFFLAVIEWILGPGDERLMVVQAGIDVLTCLGIAWLAAKFQPRAATIALWLAMLCPFMANYTATPLSETLSIFLTTVALLVLCEEHGFWVTLAGAAVVGLATEVRPESPLLLPAVGLALAWRHRREMFGRAFWPLTRTALTLAAGLLLVLLPWGYRNWVETGSFVIVANPDALLPWEHGYTGYADWANTWLVSSKETYQFGFKFEDDIINPGDLPPRAYDSEAERQRTVALIQRYNVTKSTPPDLDWEFERLARERAARSPFRQHVTVPVLRAFHYWFTPRIQLLPFSGDWYPIHEKWEDDPRDFSVTVSFFFLNVAYVSLALLGAWRYRDTLPATVMILFMLIRTAFMTTHGSIEPRYMLLCYPAVLAMGAAALLPRCDTKAA